MVQGSGSRVQNLRPRACLQEAWQKEMKTIQARPALLVIIGFTSPPFCTTAIPKQGPNEAKSRSVLTLFWDEGSVEGGTLEFHEVRVARELADLTCGILLTCLGARGDDYLLRKCSLKI